MDLARTHTTVTPPQPRISLYGQHQKQALTNVLLSLRPWLLGLPLLTKPTRYDPFGTVFAVALTIDRILTSRQHWN